MSRKYPALSTPFEMYLMRTSRAHYRAMLYRAFKTRTVWQAVCYDRGMRHESLKARVRAARRLEMQARL